MLNSGEMCGDIYIECKRQSRMVKLQGGIAELRIKPADDVD